MASPVAPNIVARVHLTAAESATGGPVMLGAQFLTTLHVEDSSFVVRLASVDGQAIALGKPVDATLEFFSAETARPKFPAGAQFKIWVGKDVGVGEVVSVVDTSNKSLERTREDKV
jgi:hypothetical protein